MSSERRDGDPETRPLSADELIDSICDEFEFVLRKGKSPRVEDFLSQVPEKLRQQLRMELDALGRDYRYGLTAAASKGPTYRQADSHTAKDESENMALEEPSKSPSPGPLSAPATVRQIRRSILIVVAIAVVATILFWSTAQWRSAEDLRVREAVDRATLPTVVQELQDLNVSSRRKLQILRTLFNTSRFNEPARQKATIALAAMDPSYLPEVIAYLRMASPKQLSSLNQAMDSLNADLADSLWRQLRERWPSEQKLRILATLARLNPESPHWDSVLDDSAELLVRENSATFAIWTKEFDGLRQDLVPFLMAISSNAKRSESHRDRATRLLISFARDQWDLLLQVLLDSPGLSFDALLGVLNKKPQQLKRQLLARLKHPNHGTNQVRPSTQLTAILKQGQGGIFSKSILVQQVNWATFQRITSKLAKSGFFPFRIRPYTLDGQEFVAAIWKRLAQPTTWITGTESEVRSQADTLKKNKQGHAWDVAGWQTSKGTNRFVAVFRSDIAPTKWLVGESMDESQAKSADWQDTHHPYSFQAFDTTAGVRICQVWRSGGGQPFPGNTTTETGEQLQKRNLAEANFQVERTVALDVHVVGANQVTLIRVADPSRMSAVRLSDSFNNTSNLAHQLHSRGFEPQSISLRIAGSQPSIALLGHKTKLGGAQRARDAQRKSHAAIALLKLGEYKFIRPWISRDRSPNVAARLAHNAANLDVPPALLLKALPKHGDQVRRALILTLGHYQWNAVGSVRLGINANLISALHDPHPGVHGAAVWACQTRNLDTQIKKALDQPAYREIPKANESRRWWINRNQQTMVILPPGKFAIGSHPGESGRVNNERQQQRHIDYRLAVSNTEVTRGQCAEFLKRHPLKLSKQRPAENSTPQVGIDYFQAAHFCNWLSEKDGIPKDQWIYIPNRQGNYELGMTMAPNWRQRRGYRLPTETEWEYACRAGTTTSRFYGDGDDLLRDYSWYQSNARGKLKSVGLKQPNHWGLFDMLGNASEWCHDAHVDYTSRTTGPLKIHELIPRATRGGSIHAPALQIRCARRSMRFPLNRDPALGFRVVRRLR